MASEKNEIIAIDELIPEEVYLLPVSHRPVFPGMIIPLVVPAGQLAESLAAVMDSIEFIGLVLQKDDSRKGVDSDNLYQIGSVARILKKVKLPKGGFHLLVSSLHRFQVEEFLLARGHIAAKIRVLREAPAEKDRELAALTRAVLSHAREIMNQNPLFTEEMKVTLVNVDEPGKIADLICSVLQLEKEEYQEVMETFEVKKRLEKTLVFLSREMDLMNLQQKIENRIQEKVSRQQKEFMLREQMEAIRSELEQGKEKEHSNEYYREKIVALGLAGEVKEKLLEEAGKLDFIDANSHEYGVLRNYLDLAMELPWGNPEKKTIDLEKARTMLEKNHFGLEEAKERIIEVLAVLKATDSRRGSIICLVGPPGVGKTSLGKSIADAMNRKFFRFSLGGMRDEAEIKGHRRTYVGAMPGKIIQALRVVKEKNPVLMLDEIDKLGSSYQGDPSSALLEVLDPEQNRDFRDHYLDLPFDLSQIVFLTTANTLDTIPRPLLDRMEIIPLSGYITEEKIVIARKYIIPKIMEEVGLKKNEAPGLNTAVLREIIEGYSREAGVRSLEKQLNRIFRKAIAARMEKRKFPAVIQKKDLIGLLGPERFHPESEAEIRHAGCALGLAYTTTGGSVLVIESSQIKSRGRFRLTGSLGKVMSESAEIAMTYVRSITDDMKFWDNHQIHIHVPDGATPKDGPSAGITITTALLSLYKNKKPKAGFAMTGEIRLTGDVLPIGGLKEKVMAARRAGIRKVIFPEENLKDWKLIPDALKKGLKPHPVSHYDQVKKLLF